MFTWYRGSEVIDNTDTKLQISNSNTIDEATRFIDVTSTLTITVVERTDFTVFTCEAANTVLGAVANDSQEFDLIVNCELFVEIAIIIIFSIPPSILENSVQEFLFYFLQFYLVLIHHQKSIGRLMPLREDQLLLGSVLRMPFLM